MLLFVCFKNSSSVHYIVVIFEPYQILILCRPHHDENAHYSQTSSKRPHKMPRVSGHLREVVAYESRLRESDCMRVGMQEARHIYFLERMYRKIPKISPSVSEPIQI